MKTFNETSLVVKTKGLKERNLFLAYAEYRGVPVQSGLLDYEYSDYPNCGWNPDSWEVCGWHRRVEGKRNDKLRFITPKTFIRYCDNWLTVQALNIL